MTDDIRSVALRWTPTTDTGSGLRTYRIWADHHLKLATDRHTNHAVITLTPGWHVIHIVAIDRADTTRSTHFLRSHLG